MDISEIKAGMMGIRIKGIIKDISEIREVNTRFGTKVQVADATLSDSTGHVKLTLWADQITKVKVGNTVEVVNGLAREWQGQIQISVGKRGELKVFG
jgi:replication factor A1